MKSDIFFVENNDGQMWLSAHMATSHRFSSNFVETT